MLKDQLDAARVAAHSIAAKQPPQVPLFPSTAGWDLNPRPPSPEVVGKSNADSRLSSLTPPPRRQQTEQTYNQGSALPRLGFKSADPTKSTSLHANAEPSNEPRSF